MKGQKLHPVRTLSVKFGIYVHQMTILKGGGVLKKILTYFLSPYINYNPLFQIIICLIL